MKMKRLALLLLSLVMILTSTLLPSTFAVSAAEQGAEYSEYDYTNPNSYFNTTLTAAGLIELFYGEISDVEKAYVEAHSNFSLGYDRVTNAGIEIKKAEGITTITAETYTYTAANGKTVVWQPVLATVLGADSETQLAEQAFAAGSTSVVFDDATVFSTENITVNIRYEFSSPISIEEEDYNAFINLAYSEVDKMADIVNFYLANGDKIVNYYNSIPLYEQYLKEKYVYDLKKAEYDKYLEDYQIYEDTLQAFNDYTTALEHFQTVKDDNDKKQAEYDAALALYEAFAEQKPTIEAQIQALDDALFTQTSDLYRDLYKSLNKDMIDKVVNNKDKIIALRPALGNYIDACAEASEAIRAILYPKNGKHYNQLKTLEEKYIFYAERYEPLRDNVLKLTTSLYTIYTTSGIKAAMHLASKQNNAPDYTEKLAIFIAQLIYFSNVLSDGPVVTDKGVTLDSGIKLDYRKQDDNTEKENIPITELVKDADGKIFVTDTGNAKPIEDVIFCEEPEEFVPTPLPVVPDPVDEPIPPTVVENPGKAPAVVAEPVFPSEDEKYKGFDWPTFIGNTEYKKTITDLVTAANNGKIKEREEATAAVTFTPTTTIVKQGTNKLVTVTFKDLDGAVLDSVTLDQGSAVVFDGQLPTKAEDLTATYVFSAWVTEDGKAYDLYSVTEDVTLYPTFTTVYKEYPKVGSDITLNFPDNDVSELPMDYFIGLANDKWANLIIESEDANVKIEMSKLGAFTDAGVASIGIDVTTGSTYTCALTAYNADGVAIDVNTTVQMYVPCQDPTFANAATLSYTDKDGVVTKVQKTYNASTGMIEFRATPGVSYTLAVKYSIKVHPNYKDIITAPDTANVGDTVTVGFTTAPGTVTEFYYTVGSDSETRYPIDGDGFVMPSGNVTLAANITFIKYTVKFESDGKVISEKVYKYGDTITAPQSPVKVNDDQYSYKFTGWSPAVADKVTSDVTYVAQFEATPLPVVEKQVNKYQVLVYGALSLFILFVTAIVLFILDRVKVISIKGIFRAIGRLFKGKKADTEKTEQTANAENTPHTVVTETAPEAENAEKEAENAKTEEKNDSAEKNDAE